MSNKLNHRITLGLAAAFLLAIGFPSATRSLADAPPPINLADNPYIELYRLRVTQAELNLERKIAVEKLTDARLGRRKKLTERGVTTQEELDTAISEATVATSERILATKKIDEAKAYLRIIEAQVARGISIPLCTYEME